MHRLQSVAAHSFEWYHLHEFEPGVVYFTGQLKRSPLEKLPFDVATRLFLFIPNLETLQAAALSCPLMHEAYTCHRKAIMQSVMEYELGLGLPFARAVYQASEIASARADLSMDCLRDPKQHLQAPITGKESRVLSHYGCTARRLGAYFSALYKDRAAPDSCLTDVEFFYFQRALFRFWALSNLTKQSGWRDLPDGDKLAFCVDLSREELAQIADVHMMLYRLMRWRTCVLFTTAVLAPGERLEEFPDVLLQRIEDQVHSEAVTLPEGEHLSYKLNELYLGLGITDDVMFIRNGKRAGLEILVGGRSHSDQCPRCKVPSVLLWGKDNWHLFRCYIPLTRLVSYLPGSLRHSLQVNEDFHNYRDIPHYAPIMYEEILGFGRRSGTEWSHDLYLCQLCLLNCLSSTTYWWYYQKRLSAGPLKPDCPDGWNCALLVQREKEHDAEFNHLCRPKPRVVQPVKTEVAVAQPPASVPANAQLEAAPTINASSRLGRDYFHNAVINHALRFFVWCFVLYQLLSVVVSVVRTIMPWWWCILGASLIIAALEEKRKACPYK